MSLYYQRLPVKTQKDKTVVSNLFLRFTLFLTLYACSLIPATCYSEFVDDEFMPRAAITINIVQDEESAQETLGWKGLFNKHLPSLCLTSAIGVITGTISASIENSNILPWPISWLLLWSTRNVAVNSLIQDMRIYKVPHNKKLAFISARLADWIAYLFCKAAYGPQIR